MRLPSQKAVAEELRALCASLGRPREEDCDVRLQVYPDGQWALRWGLSDYDQDHRGYWGASTLPKGRANLREIAKELLSQVKEDRYQATVLDPFE